MPGSKWGSDSWAFRFQPQALAGRPEGYLFAIVSVIALALIAIGDVETGPRTTIGSFQAIPILAAGWLLSQRLVLTVTLAAIALRIAVWLAGGADPLTIAVQTAVVPFMAVVGQTGAVAVVAARAAAERDARASSIVRLATSAEQITEILDELVRGLAQHQVRAHIALIDEQAQLYVAAGLDEEEAKDAALRFPLGDGAIGRVAATGGSILLERIDDPELVGKWTARCAQIRSLAAVPLISAGRPIGVIEIDSDEPDRLGPADLSLLEQVAPAVAGAVQRSGALRLADETLQQRVRELSVLLDAARGLASSLEIEAIAATICRSAAAISVASATADRRSEAVRVQGDRITVVSEYDETGSHMTGLSFPLSDHPGVSIAVREGRVTTARTSDLKSSLGARMRSLRVRVGAFAPIRVGVDVWGVLSVATRSDYAFSPADARLLQGLADLAGLAIANAELLRLERSRSDELREHGERMAALDHAKSEFLRLASHELRGPLGVLRGYVSMLAEGSLGQLPAQATTVMPILTAKVSEISGLIDQMLETARLEDSRLQLQLNEADLRDLVTLAIETIRPLAGRNHRISVQLPDEPVPVYVDAGRIQTILTNLLDNAIKYSPDGGEIRCVVRRLRERALVSIEDQGLGIDAADMPRLFQRFGRLVTSENSHIAGTGLGLYLARELARLHHGDITAESKPGRGSTFMLELPISEAAASLSA